MNMVNEIPLEAAERLMQNGFNSEKYQEIQMQRINRLTKWQEMNLTVLIKNETELIEYGNIILQIMKGHENILQN